MKFLVLASFAESLLGFRRPLIVALQGKALEVHVAAPDLPLGHPVRAELELMGLRVHSIPLRRTGVNPIADIGAFLSLLRLMLHVRPCWVLSYTVKPVVYGSLAGLMVGIPRRFALITGLGYAFQGEGKRAWLEGLVRRMYALALGGAHMVFFQNPDDEAAFRRLGILKLATPTRVVNGSGVDVVSFPEVPLPEGPPRFLLIARLLGSKGIREYVAAAQRVRARYPSVVFALVGWIDTNPDAIGQEELDAWIARGSIEYLGRLSDVRPAIAASSVYVLPSYREGTPRTVLEAMAMGRAVITTDAPGCRETVSDGENGFLVPVKSVYSLERAMVEFIEDSALVTRMGRRSRQLAEEKYDVHKVNAAMLCGMGIE